ncbi:MAG: citrate synthase [Armatimonadetes bacterium]|nr:citrate synthase [Armatimonadota bacterium]NOG92443.1 citrate synthase [Armatimonadota bacterium]
MAAQAEYSPGLAGVVAGVSTISDIDIEKSRLIYRGYDVHDIAEQGCFEEAAYLLLLGKLPNRRELDDFKKQLANERSVPDYVYEVMARVPKNAHPMDQLKVGVAALAASDPDYDVDPLNHAANVRKAIRLTAKMGNLVANGWRLAHGDPVVQPHPELDTAANFLYMLRGEKPDEYVAKSIDTSLVLYAEHGYNASTFCARVTVSAVSDIYSGIASAIGTLKGRLHGGANEKAMEMLIEIGTAENAEPYIRGKLERKELIMGFGHREYRISDSRAGIMGEMGKELGRRLGNTKWGDIADICERIMKEEKGLFPNVDFPAAYTYFLLDIPIPLYTPIFAVSRITGWSAHIIEQLDNNRIIRPKCIYEGESLRPYPPLDQR